MPKSTKTKPTAKAKAKAKPQAEPKTKSKAKPKRIADPWHADGIAAPVFNTATLVLTQDAPDIADFKSDWTDETADAAFDDARKAMAKTADPFANIAVIKGTRQFKRRTTVVDRINPNRIAYITDRDDQPGIGRKTRFMVEYRTAKGMEFALATDTKPKAVAAAMHLLTGGEIGAKVRADGKDEVKPRAEKRKPGFNPEKILQLKLPNTDVAPANTADGAKKKAA